MGAKKIAEAKTESDLIAEISRVITDLTGVQLGQKQYSLVQGRLAKRMRDLGISDPIEYSRYYNANEGIEIGVLTSLLTTHHTFFFREFQHFEYLLKVTLPAIVKSHREKGEKTLRIWSAACSRGQEVYSLSMFLRQHLPEVAPEMDFEIVGSDICEESIAIAKNGVYGWDELRPVPSVYLQGKWQKGSGNIANFVRAKDEIRKGTSFRVLNLLELNKNPFGLKAPKFDVIMCRNVFIYFSHPQIKAIVEEMLKILNPAGQLFVGLSESLNGLGLPIEWVGPSVYEQKKTKTQGKVLPLRTGEAASPERAKTVKDTQSSSASAPETRALQQQGERQLRVLCVDDSPTVLLLLKKILKPEKGFEVVGTASDGVEAVEKVKALKPDIITLDIHMPRMTGVEFLEKHFKEIRTPVVVVSSVPRDDASLAYRCLEFGASDYIEKPSAQNLEKVEEELIFKLHTADAHWRRANSGPTRSRALELDASFKRPPKILKPEGKLRIVVGNFGSRDVINVLMKGFQGTQPGTLILIDGAGDVFKDHVQKTAQLIPGARAAEPVHVKDIGPGAVVFMELEKGLALLKRESHQVKTSCLVVGPLNRSMVRQLASASFNDLIVEDRGVENPAELMVKARLIVPLTSFVYESDRYLAAGEGGI